MGGFIFSNPKSSSSNGDPHTVPLTSITQPPCYHGDGSPDRAPCACAGGRRGRSPSVFQGRSSSACFLPFESDLSTSDPRPGRQWPAVPCGLGKPLLGGKVGCFCCFPGAGTRGGGVGTPRRLAESVPVTNGFREVEAATPSQWAPHPSVRPGGSLRERRSQPAGDSAGSWSPLARLGDRAGGPGWGRSSEIDRGAFFSSPPNSSSGTLAHSGWFLFLESEPPAVVCPPGAPHSLGLY